MLVELSVRKGELKMRALWMCGLVSVVLTNCAHQRFEEMSVDQHLAEAMKAGTAARDEEKEYAPGQASMAEAGMSPWTDASPPEQFRAFHPTADHLLAANRDLREAQRHVQAAAALQDSERAACGSKSTAQRAECPAVTTSVRGVEPAARGIRLLLKKHADGSTLAGSMQCHLAFARAAGFDKVPSCPLSTRGESVVLEDGGRVIALLGDSQAAQAALRRQARALFPLQPTPSTARE
jgi:hypothetical protein